MVWHDLSYLRNKLEAELFSGEVGFFFKICFGGFSLRPRVRKKYKDELRNDKSLEEWKCVKSVSAVIYYEKHCRICLKYDCSLL